jgi:hypothetical protein
MARNTARDYAEIAKFAETFVGKRAIECITTYARKRKIVDHRAAKAFWSKVDSGIVTVITDTEGFEVITGVLEA